MIEDLVRKNRSYRRFNQSWSIDRKVLEGLINLGRLSASSANLQPLKYMISCDPESNAKVFPCLMWAGYLKDWSGPAEGERPSAYIIILGDKEISKSFDCDRGIAAQSILLGSAEAGIGGCMIDSVNRRRLRKDLEIPERYAIAMVLALGYPSEKVVLEETGPDGDIRYYRDAEDAHHVPKRPLSEIIIGQVRA